MMVNQYDGHRKRLKGRYLKAGLDGWQDYEILELALFYAMPRRDTKPLAKELIEKFKSFNGVISADIEKMISFGVPEHSALFIKLLRDIAVIYSKGSMGSKDLLSSPEAVVNFLENSLKYNSKEEFITIFLDTGNRLITAESSFTGTINRSAVYPREIAEKAINSRAAGVIIAHNHPGGSLKPSSQDLAVTEAVKKALETIEILLLDHIIVSDNGHFSFKENDLL